MLAAIDEDEHLPGIDPAETFLGIVVLSRETEPKDIHRRPDFFWFKARFLPHQGMAAVGTDGQIGADCQGTIFGFGGDARDAFLLNNKAVRYRVHE
jgi:hypothetical protein